MMEDRAKYETRPVTDLRPNSWYIHLGQIVVGPPEQEMIALFDMAGQIVQWEELLSTIEKAKPFYDCIAPSEIDAFNHRPQTIVRGPSPPRTKTYQPIDGYVYLMQCGPYYKIGASKEPSTRLAQLSTQPPFDINLLHAIKAKDMYELERQLHERFAAKRKNGEWFELDQEDVEYIKGL